MQLIKSESERDLGVIFNKILKWKDQITAAIGKANQMLGWVKKSFAKFDYCLLSSLYQTFIRPLLEFAIPVWSPYLKGDYEAIEKVQRD